MSYEKNTVILIRGLPGSGKSTLARQLFRAHQLTNECYHFETDQFFLDGMGNYRFDPKKLGEYHLKNFKWYCHALDLNTNNRPLLVIVSNTFTQRWEAAPYIAYAQIKGFDVEIKVPDTPWAFNVQECAEKCVHGVFTDTIRRMNARFEESDSWLK